MRIFRIIWFRLRALLQREAVDAELNDELLFHIERETAENIKRGMSPDEARRTAYARFGGLENFKEELRDEREVRWLDDISADVRHGFRLLNKNRLFSAAVILTLALGIGATSTIFAIVNSVLLRPLPFPEADRIVTLSEQYDGRDGGNAGQKAVNIWMEASKSFSTIAIYSDAIAVLTGQGEPTETQGGAGTIGFFDVFRATVFRGRAFKPEDYAAGAPKVVVLSHELWQNAFGGDTTILNQAIDMNGRQRTVVGIMAPGFSFPDGARYWVPLVPPNDPGTEYFLSPVARLKDGVSLESALADIKRLMPQVNALRPKMQQNAVPVLMTLHERRFGSTRKPLTILSGAVVVLLLIACANVANLTLARSATRQREFAIRLALGAKRWRLVRQLLVESMVLASIGGALGIVLPVLLVNTFAKLSPSSVAGVSDISVDGAVLIFTAGVSLVAALVFGLAPAITGSRSNAPGALGAGSTRSTQTRRHRMVRASLVVFEVSAALTLITGAALLTRSFSRAVSVDPGFDPKNLYSVSFSLPSARYPEAALRREFYRQLAERVAAFNGVGTVALSSSRPMGGYSYSRKMSRTDEDAQRIDVAFGDVDANYGKTVGLKLIAGRFIDETDVTGAPLAVMITKSAADYFFPGQSAIGRTLPRLRNDTEPPKVVVGVVGDVLQMSLDRPSVPQAFESQAQRDGLPQVLNIRTTLSPAVVREQLKAVTRAIDPLLPLSNFHVAEEDVAMTIAPRRFNSLLINAFAILALTLAIVGLYGLMAHAVATRTRELGIRIALGAQSDNVLRLVMKQGAWLILCGICIGAALSLALSRTVASLLYNTAAQDPISFIGAPMLLLIVGLVACYIPARRATQVSPSTALRQE